ncbi:hemolysin-III related-domain-containing protein [Mycotypha africana]|uniref:hemolysin-III related-domain-containing protein n=1 Tax=Mycotypha africana TaxID=64632 RepID=UPI0023019547|nr:hemolysin-III related-domain-containing protein [Mycotypha africana]KAI8969297.1 hemolysin-III related-domain-containing protein [Mycotypha africana]
MAPPQISEQSFLDSLDLLSASPMTNAQHARRYSQSQLLSATGKKDSLTVPYHRRGRSNSISVVPGSSLAAHILATVNTTFQNTKKSADNDDSNGSLSQQVLDYVDGQVHDTWEVAKALMLGSTRLLLLEELPKDRQENQYVLSGYRFYRSSRECLKSLFKIHNETLNIWSHLLGFFFFSYLSIYAFKTNFPEASSRDIAIFSAFCISSLTCLLCSSIYHTFICHSARHIKSFTATLDYIGITFLITASISIVIHFGFYCDPIPKHRYMIFSGLIGSIGIILPFFRFFDTKRYRPLRIGLFVAMAFSSVVPLLHLMTVKGVLVTAAFLKPALVSALMYICGVVIYGKRFPEKFFPGKFDAAGMTSHAIWHLFVCLGIFFHYLGSFHFYKLREEFGCMFAPTE